MIEVSFRRGWLAAFRNDIEGGLYTGQAFSFYLKAGGLFNTRTESDRTFVRKAKKIAPKINISTLQ
jgi:hypothetical protein